MRASFRLPLVPLLLLWAVCSVVQVQAEVKAVKLCGREFIRAVVYTCGGSRWRRLLTPQNDGESQYYLHPQARISSTCCTGWIHKEAFYCCRFHVKIKCDLTKKKTWNHCLFGDFFIYCMTFYNGHYRCKAALQKCGCRFRSPTNIGVQTQSRPKRNPSSPEWR